MNETARKNEMANANLAGKYLTFTIREESYGVAVIKVREIVRFSNITPVPQVPPYVCGVINLRGKIIPVIDLRVRLGFGAARMTSQTCIIVLQLVHEDGRAVQTGLVVDAVEEVVNIPATDIEPPPDFGASVSTDCILGMAKVKGIIKTLLDIDPLLLSEQLP